MTSKNPCSGAGQRALIGPNGIGHQCPVCGMLTVPTKTSGNVRRHGILSPPPPWLKKVNPPCSKCGGPHPFDTVVPSVRWNAIIRTNHYPDYLCLTCIVNAFVLANESFTATLWGGFFNGMAIEVRVNEQPAIDAAAISHENTELRAQIAELVAAQASPLTPQHLCGTQGFGARGDTCPACEVTSPPTPRRKEEKWESE